jgi:hypothetical protein
MIYLNGSITIGGIAWQVWLNSSRFGEDSDGVRLGFHFHYKTQKRAALEVLRQRIQEIPIPWLIPGRKEWVVDCDKMKHAFDFLKDEKWLQGRIPLELEWEETVDQNKHKLSVLFYITPDIIKEAVTMSPIAGSPPEITESLKKFRMDHPDTMKVAFIMMRFGTTEAHTDITASIKSTLASRGIAALRADDKQYHDDLFYNILTYIYGCGFGVAVFERLESEDFNPNVSLEVGYMLGLRKPVCLVKDKTLKTLHTDLVGKLYKSFDPQKPNKTIATELEQWLKDKGL